MRRLQADPDCRQALEMLRRTSMLLRSLPVRRVPRNFTLSARSRSQKTDSIFVGVLRFSSAAAALLLMAAFALDFAQKPRTEITAKAVDEMAPETAALQAPEQPAGEAPMIIFWGAPAPMMGAYGKGGGGAEGPGVGGGGAATGFYGVGGGAPEESTSEAAPLAEELPAADATPSAEMPAPESLESRQPEAELQTQAEIVPEPLTGSGPILGVRAPGEKASDAAGAEVPLRQPVAAALPFRTLEILLALLLVLTAIPAWLLKKK